MSASGLHPGHLLTVTATGKRVVIWSAAPEAGHYWAHLMPEAVLVKISVRHASNAALPTVKVVEGA